ncbi:hypothetical protein BH23THE1_BH23THE1_08490 [soil metagenome]
MVDINRQYRYFFMKHGEPSFEIFSLASKETVMKFAKLSLEIFVLILEISLEITCAPAGI